MTTRRDEPLGVSREIVDYGDRGLLVQLRNPGDIGPFCLAVRARCDPGVIDVVATEQHVLVVHHLDTNRHRLRAWLATVSTAAATVADSPAVLISVIYDGEDLETVADACGITVAKVVDLHRNGIYQAAFCGFAPGFAYLRGIDTRLQLPRRDHPRPSVEAGSVAIAAGYCGIYPRRMPGGWHIIGHTTASLWDLDRRPPALIEPGTTVRFNDREQEH